MKVARLMLPLFCSLFALSAHAQGGVAPAEQTEIQVTPDDIVAGSADTSITVTLKGLPAQDIYVNCSLLVNKPGSPMSPYISSYKYPKNVKVPSAAVVVLGKELLTKQQVIIISTAKDCKGDVTRIFVEDGVTQMAPFGETVVGVDVSAASSASPQAVFLLLNTIDIPFKKISDLSTQTKNIFWISGKLGIAGMAQPGNLSGAASSGFYSSAINANPDKIVQSVDAAAYFGYQFMGRQVNGGTFDSGTEKLDDPKTLFTLSVVLGLGAITPLSASQANPPVYEATPLILQTQTPYSPTSSFPTSCTPSSPTASPVCYVAFVPGDRTRFYRHYEAGLRLKIYAEDKTDRRLRFPGIIDAAIGQNEYVTGGNLSGLVFHVFGSFPVPVLDGVYTFGSMDLALARNSGGNQLLLIPAPVTAGVTFTSPSVYLISTTQPNRDRYQLGFGVDVFHLFSKYFGSKKTSSDASGS
jgi:hypothetical protein